MVGWDEPDSNVPPITVILAYRVTLPASELKHFTIESDIATAPATAVMALYEDDNNDGDPDFLVAVSDQFELNGSLYITNELSVGLSAGNYWVAVLFEDPNPGIVRLSASGSNAAGTLWAQVATFPNLPNPFVPLASGGAPNYQYALSVIIEEN